MHWTWLNCLFTALGVFLLYARWGRSGLRYYVPRDLLDTFHLSEDRKSQVELVVFMMVGTLVATACVEPQTARQAIAAGLGWTGLLASPNAKAR
jgi:hypothetical protein